MNPADAFDPLRPRLLRIAYRMLGIVAEAEDVVQEAYLRWHQTDRAAVRDAEAVLVRTVTRLCLDVLKSARVRREEYVGTWLPEPIVDAVEGDDLTLPLMMALERLSPLERAAFLLHDVFGMDFEEVAKAMGRAPAACRQLASRARAHVREARPRFPVSEAQGSELASAFYAASRSGDMGALQALLAQDVVVYSDGGGKVKAALNPIYGQEKTVRFFEGLLRITGVNASQLVHEGFIDGLPAFVTLEKDGTLQTTALDIEDGRVATIYVTRNPDKLQGIRGLVGDKLPS
ncbi:RNA polymerase sigma-70 factor, ECF subfamily [Myxococcus xanthus DK 1622]|uniref:RNA polymerase sigma-70 factor, ECF subfamily n=1 Tax=Myxococcus xanthus (strain DK1622) TaxID=246197 RepID=Q1DAB6_MYXXD|nr:MULTISPECIES: sigma-70 family RNA polymerase sigma factor [Myxococcus]ABF89067.1 RNA polymerase sigma-70 factor, ECF subfamily [Myxococcus xanthus DK 1622]NOJ57329.1 sigma-70 family RNA polymerase sigma factor [Myxococcus xanthus]QPM81722.1 sigma-70 family RNA polymerase sigma factor [Myxococcus xanthus]QVW70973.1 sigma-70 family RNA polymerase sigma factor [Myxococcus xanthus DZ2]QZZ49911.1 ECF RNA polymerase sigma factor SigJ [Myxococcus xanthus]